MSRKPSEGERLNRVLPRIEALPEEGLTPQQAHERLVNGYGNSMTQPPTKSVWQIIAGNIFTYFNLLFCVFALIIILVGSYRNLTFMPIIIINSAIGIVQELRSKRAIDKLTFIAEAKATVIRGGERIQIPTTQTVRDDVAVISGGEQVYADAILLSGECRVNEALVTGEANEITKTVGDTLLSGSFVVSGSCAARLDKVGQDSFVAQLTIEAKKAGKKHESEMMGALTRLVKIIGIIVIPLGILMFLQQSRVIERSITDSVVSTVAALIGMIPEGLYLLVSIALTVSIMRLTQKRTLVHEMGCIETLARVDVLCVDKTGTITEPTMIVKDVVPLDQNRFGEDEVRTIMSDYVGNMGAENETMEALQKFFTHDVRRRAVKTLPFSSANKYSGLTYGSGETYLLGAPEMILLDDYAQYAEAVEKYSAMGCRVLLLAMYDGDISVDGIHGGVMPVSLILLTNKVREAAPPAFRFFAEQGVTVKVISGDNPLTVSQVAVEAGIEGGEKYVDARTLTTERKLRRAVDEYTVFGRVTPDQKRRLVRALKSRGHTVAMTGDGVNDVLALKDADCSVAMASGSDVACRVAQIVLMDSDFAAMPAVVMEGRRVINNIERSASLYLIKNIFSFTLAVTSLIFTLAYPITPSQLTLVNVMTIGIPSFFLALEPNKSLVRGKFLRNVLFAAAPAGLTDYIAILAAVLIAPKLGVTDAQIATIATIIMGSVGLAMLFLLCRPFNALRKALFFSMLAGFVLGGLLLPKLFALVALTWKGILLTAAIVIAAVPLMLILTAAMRAVRISAEARGKYRVKY